MNLYLGLVHYPVHNKLGQTITSSVSNLDIHDIARCCRSYGAKRYFIITPLRAQQRFLQRILDHWQDQRNRVYNPDRAEALALACWRTSWEEARQDIAGREGHQPLVVATSASLPESDGSCQDLVARLSIDKRSVFILFGTSWGLHGEVIAHSDFRLAPLGGCSADGYNHLPVRSAVAIYLDRLALALADAQEGSGVSHEYC